MAEINVRFYGRLAEQFGTSARVPIPDLGCTVGELRRLLPGLGPPSGIRAAVGDELVPDDRHVLPTEEVEFLAPLSGG